MAHGYGQVKGFANLSLIKLRLIKRNYSDRSILDCLIHKGWGTQPLHEHTVLGLFVGARFPRP